MTLTAEKELEHLGETVGCADHDHDLVHELSRRLDSIWRLDQYMANADHWDELQEFWRTLKKQEQSNIDQLKQLISEEIQKDCF